MVANEIRTRIDRGDWGPGTVLPAEIALAKEFRVSVGTIRRALGDLTSGGILARRRKTGTVVTGRTAHHSLRFFYDYFRLHSREGDFQNSTSRTLRVEHRPASDSEAERLGIAPGAGVQVLHRLRLVADRPVMHDLIILPADLAPGLLADPQNVPERIYPLLWSKYGLKISAIREQLEADLASEEDCRLLNLTPPAPIMVLNEVAYDEMAQPILINYHRATTKNDVYINEIQ